MDEVSELNKDLFPFQTLLFFSARFDISGLRKKKRKEKLFRASLMML